MIDALVSETVSLVLFNIFPTERKGSESWCHTCRPLLDGVVKVKCGCHSWLHRCVWSRWPADSRCGHSPSAQQRPVWTRNKPGLCWTPPSGSADLQYQSSSRKLNITERSCASVHSFPCYFLLYRKCGRGVCLMSRAWIWQSDGRTCWFSTEPLPKKPPERTGTKRSTTRSDINSIQLTLLTERKKKPDFARWRFNHTAKRREEKPRNMWCSLMRAGEVLRHLLLRPERVVSLKDSV